MKIPLAAAFILAVALTAAAWAQDSSAAPPAGQDSGGYRGSGYGQRGGRSGMGGMAMGGRGLMGTVTEVAADHYTIKTDAGDIYTVHYSANTRILKMPAGARGQGMGEGGGQGQGGGQGEGRGMGRGGNPPEQLKASDIKAGDVIEVRGETDTAAKSVGAVAVVQLDPERVKQIREMEANYGKTWLMGKVTAIDGVKVTLTGVVDNAPHSFAADENTTFRRRRDPITLADIQVGETVRVDGALKDGVFTAATVGVMGMTQGENPNAPRGAAPPSSPQ
jgi:hypothetical protein